MSAEIEVADLVMADFAQRKKMGIAKYGRTLTPWTIEKPLREAYEEQLDFCIYMRAALERYERGRQ